jgi:hypothetical protein
MNRARVAGWHVGQLVMVWFGTLVGAAVALAFAVVAADIAPSTYQIDARSVAPAAPLDSLYGEYLREKAAKDPRVAAYERTASPAGAARSCYSPDNPFAPAELRCEPAVDRGALVRRRYMWLTATSLCVGLAAALVAFPVWATWTWFGARAAPLSRSATD